MPRRRRRAHDNGPRCPRCRRIFGKDSDVVNHMNQPWTKCANWTSNLEQISTKQNLPQQQYQGPNPQLLTELDTSADDDGMWVDEDGDTPAHTDCDSGAMQFVESFPGAGEKYGMGKTFMDNFDSDDHASRRLENIYYPFQSQSEWALASWLLRSKLSLQEINDFLSLELVSIPLFLFSDVLRLINQRYEDSETLAFISQGKRPSCSR